MAYDETVPDDTPKPRRTPEEQAVLDQVTRTHGTAWVGRHEELILDQARSIGTLPESDDDEPHGAE